MASSGCSIKHHKDSFSKGKFKRTRHLPLIMVNGTGSTSMCSDMDKLGKDLGPVDRALDAGE